MVEINNQRKGVPRVLAWSEGTDNGRRRKPRNHGYDVIVTEAVCSYSDRLTDTYFDPKLKSTGARRYQLLSRWWDAYRKQLGLKTSLRKVRTLWHCSRLRSVALFTMIDRGDIRQAIDRYANIWASLPRRWLCPVPSIRLTA